MVFFSTFQLFFLGKLKYWLQAYLGGVEEVFVGEESNRDMVGRFNVLKVDSCRDSEAVNDSNGSSIGTKLPGNLLMDSKTTMSNNPFVPLESRLRALDSLEKQLAFVRENVTPGAWSLTIEKDEAQLNNKGGKGSSNFAKDTHSTSSFSNNRQYPPLKMTLRKVKDPRPSFVFEIFQDL